jgi:hypothetical protein
MLSIEFINKNLITQITNEDIIKNVKNFYEKEYLTNYKNSYENLISVSIENAILNKKNINKYLNFNRLNEIYVKNIKDFIKPVDNYSCIKKHICYDFIKKYVINCHDNDNNNKINILYIHVFNIDEKLKNYEIKLNETKDDTEIKFYNLEHKIKDNKYNFDDKIKVIEDKVNTIKTNYELKINHIETKFNKLIYLIAILNAICIIIIINM